MKPSKAFNLLIISILASNFCFAQINPDDVTIARDKFGVPHIFAKTDAQVAYGLAFAHAEDDFKTIQLPLLAGKGMLGQVLGKNGASVDYVVGLIRAREEAERDYPTTISPEFKAVLKGYVQGLNAYAAKHPDEVLLKKAFPVTEIDAMSAFVLSLSVFSGLDNALKNIFAGNVQVLEEFSPKASNGFALSSRRTTDGKTYLNINSHQPLEGAVAWYEAHLCSEEGWNILGGLFPGGMSIFHGVNEHLGWAHMVNYHDKMDIFQLEMNPENKLQYKFDNAWLTLEERTIKLKVKVGAFKITVKKKAYWSKYGPTVMSKKGTFSLRFATLFDIRAGEEWYKMDKAKNFQEFYEALKMTSIPGFHIAYADREDNIFYLSNGKIPLRNPDYNWLGTLPGNTSKTLWTAFHPLEDLPQVLNPKSGYIFNTNNTPFNVSGKDDNPKPEKFDKTMGTETWMNNRATRFQTLISQQEKFSFEDFKRIKYDQQYPEKTFNFWGDNSALFQLKETEYPDIQAVIKKINHWDKRGNVENRDVAAPLLATYFLNEKFGDTKNNVLTHDQAAEALRHAQTHLLKYFGTVDIALGDLQKLVRGKKELPIWGVPDVIAAMTSKPYKNGRLQANSGESYIMLVKFSKENLPEIETVNVFGTSNHADSPHFDDQMELFQQQKTKKMTLDKATILREAKRIYHPK